MAEGGKASGPEVDASSDEAAPAAIALALGGSGARARLAPEAAAYLRKQGRLVDLQIENLEGDRAIQHRHLALKFFADRLRIALWLLAVALGMAVVLGLGVMVWQASHDRNLVVEAFSVPPDFSQRGLTGQVVARQILDRLTDLQAQTRSMRAAASFKNNWGDAPKVEIPETGVSIGELRDSLRGWLGHETHISGEVYRTPTGVTLTTRVGDAATSFSGADGDLEKLTQQSAEAIFGRAQPYRYSVFLDGQNRLAEARAVLEALSGDPDPVERAWAYRGLGVQRSELGDPAGCVRNAAAAVREVPGFAPALLDLADCEMDLGRDHEALRFARAYVDARQSLQRYVSLDRRDWHNADALVLIDQIVGDYAGEIAQARRLLAMRLPAAQAAGRDNLAIALALDHDLAGLRDAVGTPEPGNSDQFVLLGRTATGTGDPAAVGLLARATTLDAEQRPQAVLRRDAPWLAIAKARFGDLAAAQALIATTPTDCYLCVRARGVVASARGDRRESERWLAEAIRQGPDLPQAFTERGAARLTWGDVAGALTDARHANAVSPRNPDALKLWGDALARESRWREARARYDAALTFAPAWVALRQARNAAGQRAG